MSRAVRAASPCGHTPACHRGLPRRKCARPCDECSALYVSICGAQLVSRVAQVDALYADFGDALREERYAQAAKEGIRANAAWLARNAAPLCAWLGAA